MNGLFLVLLIFTVLLVIRGARKGFVRTAVSMVFMILILAIVSWINPYVGKFLRESTPVYQMIKEHCEPLLMEQMAGGIETPEEEKKSESEVPLELQIKIIENIPLPQEIKDNLLENNNSEVYKALGAERFIDYLTSYIAYCITNGIGFLISFIIAIILMKVILYAVDILAGLPVISFFNVIAGMLLGIVQAVLWIWIFFIIVTVLCNTPVGQVIMNQIEGSEVLKILYEQNILMDVIMSVILG